jgi:hypothetical protein
VNRQLSPKDSALLRDAWRDLRRAAGAMKPAAPDRPKENFRAIHPASSSEAPSPISVGQVIGRHKDFDDYVHRG